MEKQKLVAVVIPIYELQPNADETQVLSYYFRLFESYPIIFMTQEGLDTSFYEQIGKEQGHTNFSFERFTWKGYQQYIRLLVSPHFYERFLNYEYILLAHLDSFAFKAELEPWCKLGYDYIGAVIYNKSFVEEYIQSSSLLKLLRRFGMIPRFPAQNGGFSLRKVNSFYKNSRRFSYVIKNTSIVYTEDLFWSLRLPQMNPFFRVAPEKVAHKFAIELPSEKAPDFEPFVNDLSELPMGCHGWKAYGYSFWKAHLERVMQTKLSEIA
ncbi:DUF5672 family protein [Xanthocytophaga agilis]|uniref:DUF5672 family protein n=1 Tax=Xanthocytophaga agilis TaxID=3048010 RepID=A0AAE3R6N5_9BACT|nr:DUF5672 family protein [Xanthocytophaga agilis]MDJ1504591.1 DUF5672 family protein [Xanthocytophaga agilis]